MGACRGTAGRTEGPSAAAVVDWRSARHNTVAAWRLVEPAPIGTGRQCGRLRDHPELP